MITLSPYFYVDNPPLQKLPNHLMIQIFEYLPLSSKILVASRLNKQLSAYYFSLKKDIEGELKRVVIKISKKISIYWQNNEEIRFECQIRYWAMRKKGIYKGFIFYTLDKIKEPRSFMANKSISFEILDPAGLTKKVITECHADLDPLLQKTMRNMANVIFKLKCERFKDKRNHKDHGERREDIHLLKKSAIPSEEMKCFKQALE